MVGAPATKQGHQGVPLVCLRKNIGLTLRNRYPVLRRIVAQKTMTIQTVQPHNRIEADPIRMIDRELGSEKH